MLSFHHSFPRKAVTPATSMMKRYQPRTKSTQMMKKRKRPREHSRKRSSSKEDKALLMTSWVRAAKKKERKEKSKGQVGIIIISISHQIREVMGTRGSIKQVTPEEAINISEEEAETIRLPPFHSILPVCHWTISNQTNRQIITQWTIINNSRLLSPLHRWTNSSKTLWSSNSSNFCCISSSNTISS